MLYRLVTIMNQASDPLASENCPLAPLKKALRYMMTLEKKIPHNYGINN